MYWFCIGDLDQFTFRKLILQIFWDSFIGNHIILWENKNNIPCTISGGKSSAIPFILLVIFLSFDNSYYNWHEIVSHWGFDLHFCNDKWYWKLLNVFFGHSYFFFWEMFIHFLTILSVFVIVELFEFLS